jgi:UDP:flavonoid glycosyltransferase YjiC (YdhE family)
VFVSHCGRNSQIEAAYFGVPLVCVPVDFDQLYNAESMARQRMGVVLDRKCVEPKKKNPNR